MASISPDDPRLNSVFNAAMNVYVPPAQRRTDPSFVEIATSAFATENLIVSGFNAVGGFIDLFADEDDPDFDPLETVDPNRPHGADNPFLHIQGYQGFAENFIRARNRMDVERIKRRIDRELEHREVLANGGVTGFLAAMVAGTADPLIFVPGVKAVQGVKGGAGFARTAVKFGAAGAGLAAVQEAGLQLTQETRTIEESGMNVGGTAILGGLLGLVARGISGKVARDVAESLDAPLSAKDDLPGFVTPQETPRTISVGMAKGEKGKTAVIIEGGESAVAAQEAADRIQDAAEGLPGFGAVGPVTDVGDIGVLPTGTGIERIADKISPRLQLFRAEDPNVREVASGLVASGVRLKGAQGPDAETAKAIWLGRETRITAMHDQLYARYVSDGVKQRATKSQALFGFRRVEGKLSREEFDVEVAKAHRRGDVHDVPEVQEAARIERRFVFDPLMEDGIAVGLLPENVRQNTHWLHRMWNQQTLRVPEERAALVSELVEWAREKAAQNESAFSEARAKAMAERAIDKIISIPDGRTLPGDVSMRSVFLERVLDIPDERIERFLVNDNARIRRYTVRTMAADIELARRHGLHRMRPGIDAMRGTVVAQLAQAASAKNVHNILIKFDRQLKTMAGGDRFGKSLAGGRKLLAKKLWEVIKEHSVEGRVPDRVRLRDSMRELLGLMDAEPADIRALNKLSDDDLAKELRERGVIAEGGAQPNDGAQLAVAMDEVLKIRDERRIARWTTGNMELAFDRIESAAAKQIKELNRTDLAAAVNRRKRHQRDMRNLRLARDDIRGLYGLPENPAAITPRLLRGVRQFNLLRVGGMIALASINDMAFQAMNFGLRRTFGYVFSPLLRDLNAIKLSARDARNFKGVSDMLTNLRANRLFDIEDDFLPRTRLEKGLSKLTHGYSIANLMSPWNAAMDHMHSVLYTGMVMDAATSLARTGKAAKADLDRLLELGLREADLLNIAKEFDLHGGGRLRGPDRLLFPNVMAWGDRGLRDKFGQAMLRSRELTILRGGPMDRPNLPLGNDTARLLWQYRNFALKANTALMVRGLQYRDARMMSGVLFSTSLGMLAVWSRALAAGREPPQDWKNWLGQGIERSGVTGMLFDVDRIVELVTNGQAGLGVALGLDTGRGHFYSPQDLLSAALGPGVGSLLEALNLGTGMLDMSIDPQDVRRLRRLIIMQNHFALARLFNELEESAQ